MMRPVEMLRPGERGAKVQAIESDELLRNALRLITEALALLDEEGTVSAIGAHLDLARARLEEHLTDRRN